MDVREKCLRNFPNNDSASPYNMWLCAERIGLSPYTNSIFYEEMSMDTKDTDRREMSTDAYICDFERTFIM